MDSFETRKRWPSDSGHVISAVMGLADVEVGRGGVVDEVEDSVALVRVSTGHRMRRGT